MKNFSSALRAALIVLWHAALFITGLALLAVWLAAWWLKRTIGQALPRIVAALPEKYHPVLLTVAAFTVKLSNKD